MDGTKTVLYRLYLLMAVLSLVGLVFSHQTWAFGLAMLWAMTSIVQMTDFFIEVNRKDGRLFFQVHHTISAFLCLVCMVCSYGLSSPNKFVYAISLICWVFVAGVLVLWQSFHLRVWMELHWMG